MDAISFVQVIFLAIVQGLAELLPVSSSAHVIVAEKLMGLDPSTPAMTFLLVMLHTGTMFSVILYFWPKWVMLWRSEKRRGFPFTRHCVIATGCTGVLGLGLKAAIELTILRDTPTPEIEELFRNLPLMGTSLLVAAILIIVAGIYISEHPSRGEGEPTMTNKDAAIVGIVQGLCLPFRGFSRSGATISTSLLQRVPRELAETFSFTLAVILTPPVLALEVHRLFKAVIAGGGTHFNAAVFAPGLVGMVFSFLAGLTALRWLSSWLENGRWHYFGLYCLLASGGVFAVYFWTLD